MGKTVRITCDGCGGDITTGTYSVDYRLDVAHYFCGSGCLDLWRDRARHRDMLFRERLSAWVDEFGARYDDGHVHSYPEPPRETYDTWRSESEAAALVAFPMKSAGGQQGGV